MAVERALTNDTISKIQHLMSSTSNFTSHYIPFPADLALVLPHLLAHAASFAFITVPERIENILHGGSVIAEATGNISGSQRVLSAALSKSTGVAVAASQASAAPAASAAAAASHTSVTQSISAAFRGGPLHFGSVTFQQLRNLGGVFLYITSKWALACFALAILLNRTQLYAAARRNIVLRWPLRLALRVIPIILFAAHSLTLLRVIRCQTSPNYLDLRYGGHEKPTGVDFAGEGGFLYQMSSKLLSPLLESDEGSCRAVNMLVVAGSPQDRRGSLSFLWPLFQALCVGQFIEQLSCAVQGRPLMTEIGMSIFEHSLAFAEAEGMLTSTLGLSIFGVESAKDTDMPAGLDKGAKLSKGALFRGLNTPPEIILMALISGLNNLASHILGVFDLQSQYRLINTGIWGLCFMIAFLWGLASTRPESTVPENIILRFPTVCIVGFVPHFLITLGIIVCSIIYVLALSLCILSGPDEVSRRGFRERFRWARDNMQANTHLSSIRIDMQQDFYTVLLQIGFTALTAASEAVYLNEWRGVGVSKLTWLEDERIKVLSASGIVQDQSYGMAAVSSSSDASKDQSSSDGTWKSGYDKQRTLEQIRKTPQGTRRRGSCDGVGHLQRRSRILLACSLLEGTFRLVLSWLQLLFDKSLDQANIKWRPRWLHSSRSDGKHDDSSSRARSTPRPSPLDSWMLDNTDLLSLPPGEDVDVEEETRRRMEASFDDDEAALEKAVSSNLYEWWKHGGWWGEKDASGSYAPSQADDEDDGHSLVSCSTTTDNEWESDGSGYATPTNRSVHRHMPISRGGFRDRPISDHALDPATLASLLDPKDAATRNEAKLLAHHLSSPYITTRSRYRHAQTIANSKFLTTSRHRPPSCRHIPTSGPLTPEDEAQLLEHLIISHRAAHARAPSTSNDTSHSQSKSADDDPIKFSTHTPSTSPIAASHTAADESINDPWNAEGTPSCVVCQSAPRTILAWPCRCLSLCEECRVSLAMNNFGTCVCCRQEVVGFSRLFVP